MPYICIPHQALISNPQDLFQLILGKFCNGSNRVVIINSGFIARSKINRSCCVSTAIIKLITHHLLEIEGEITCSFCIEVINATSTQSSRPRSQNNIQRIQN